MIADNTNNLAPIILFVYNRPWHTRQTVEALQKNELASESVLYVFADGEKPNATDEQIDNIAKVRNYIHTISGFKEVHIEEAEQNKGLANSVISGVTKTIEEYGKVIVVEDDIVTYPFFLRFMNEALEYYANDTRIFMIGGFRSSFKIPWWYIYDVFIVHRACSWGWATWKSRWVKADWMVSEFDSFKKDAVEIEKLNRGGNDMYPMLESQMKGDLDSWAIRWDYCMYRNDAYCIMPVKTLVNNIGFDGTGVHCGKRDSNIYVAPSYDYTKYRIRLRKNISPNCSIEKSFYSFNSRIWTGNVPFAKRVKRKIKNAIRVCLNFNSIIC